MTEQSEKNLSGEDGQDGYSSLIQHCKTVYHLFPGCGRNQHDEEDGEIHGRALVSPAFRRNPLFWLNLQCVKD